MSNKGHGDTLTCENQALLQGKNPQRQSLVDIVRKLHAIEVLEYHDMNLLASMQFVSEEKQRMLKEAMVILERFSLDDSSGTPPSPLDWGMG